MKKWKNNWLSGGGVDCVSVDTEDESILLYSAVDDDHDDDGDDEE